MTVEFMRRGSFAPVTDMVGGGPFGLAPGQWTDDTSMALCLAESLLSKGGFDARDLLAYALGVAVAMWLEQRLIPAARAPDAARSSSASPSP